MSDKTPYLGNPQKTIEVRICISKEVRTELFD